MSRLSVLGLLGVVGVLGSGCTRSSDATSYRPSMTMLRLGEVVVEDPPVIPEDNFIPGIVVAPDDVFYDGESGMRVAPDAWAALTDFGRMDDLDDPGALAKHVGEYDYTLLDGALIDEHAEQGIAYDDVNQGAIGDCYLVAALAGVVYSDNVGIIDGMVREIKDADGQLLRYAVRFYDAWGEPQDVEVDAQLIRRNGKPLYARSADSRTTDEELWVGIVEKAYAKWHGDYEKIGNGGYPGDVMQALTGANASFKTLQYQSDDTLFDAVVEAVNEGRPVASGTFGEDSDVDYEGTGVYAWHAYTVLGADRTEEGGYRVQLRNPWGSSEPADNGPDDGIFFLDFGDWRRLYSNVVLGGRAERDVVAPADVTDLKLLELLDGTALLEFTATGDDATEGLAYQYDIRLSTSPIDDTNFYEGIRVGSADPKSPGSSETLQVTGISGAAPFYVALKVMDESGNGSPISNVVEIVPATRETYRGSLSFDFEGSTEVWTADGAFHLSNLDAASGAQSYYMGSESQLNYAIGDRTIGSLTSPALDLTGGSTVEMLWEQILDVEEGEYDAASLQVTSSADGFSNATVVWQKNGTHTSWALEYVDLTAFAGQVVELRFEFDSTDNTNNDGLGWFVDNVYIDFY